MNKNNPILCPIVLFVALLLSCGGKKETGLILPDGKKNFRLDQRSSTELEGHNRNISISIDDITGGQTQLKITDGEITLLEKNISEGGIHHFEFDGHKYMIECTGQTNVLIGTDYADFIVRNPTEEERNFTGRTEEEKIEALIAKVSASNVIFIRNGDEHDAQEAAEHLRKKWRSSGGKVKTLADFIEHIASYSSTTGEAYLIKLPEGNTVSANNWMKEQAKGL